MRHPTVNALCAYWDELRAGRLAPARGDLEPAGISELLPYAFILERTGRGEARFRLAGEAIGDLIGMDPTGMSANAIWSEGSAEQVTQMIESVVSAPATAIAVGRSPAVGTIAGALAEFCYPPLRSDSGEINRIIGCAAALDGERIWNGAEPRLFAVQDMRITAVESEIEQNEGPSAYLQPEAPDYPVAAESAAPFQLKSIDGKFANEDRRPVATPDRARPHLRLVKDDE